MIIPICSLFIIAGLWMMFKGGQVCIKAYRTKSWERSTGKIIESKIETTCDSDCDTLYEAKIDYAYSFEGKTYNGNRIHYGYSATNDKEDSEVLTNFLSKGESVPVYINQNRPDESVLVQGIQKYAFIEIWGGFGFSFMGFWVIIYVAFISRDPTEFFQENNPSIM